MSSTLMAQTASWTCTVEPGHINVTQPVATGGSLAAACGASGTLSQDGGNLLRFWTAQPAGSGNCIGYLTGCTTTGAFTCAPTGSAVATISCGVSYSCPPGKSYSGGQCIESGTGTECKGKTGQTYSGQVRDPGGTTPACPSTVRGVGGCSVKVDFCHSSLGEDGLAYWVFGGSYDGASSANGTPVGQAPGSGGSGAGAIPGATSTSTGPNAGTTGGGTTGGGFNGTDATNLSRIATNTATSINAIDSASAKASSSGQRLEGKLDALKGAIEASGNGGAISGQCGGPSQPKCQIDESGIITEANSGSIESATAANTASKDAAKQLQTNASAVGATSSIGASITAMFAPAWPESSCRYETNAPSKIASTDTQTLAFDYCSQQSMIHTVMSFFLAAMLLFGLQDLFFKTRETI